VRTESIWAAIGGAIVGWVLWLVAFSIAQYVTTVSLWSLILLALSVVLALWAVLWGRRLRQRGSQALASFAFALPVFPVVVSLAVLARIYL
jgi:hypothetical protein